ncbi:hypothetical protein HDK77DRAFT_507621 [Phyllosticta capitalensis]
MHTVTMDAAVAVAVADSPALSASSSIDYSLSTTSLDDPTSSTFPPPGAPSSALFEVRETPLAGRGVFATQDIAAGTPLLTVEAPSADVILREYRRELCGWCFAYDRGREWKLRDNSVGFAFCGAECHERWRRHQGDEGVAAWSAVERLCKGRPREQEMGDADAPIPTVAEIDAAWDVASQTASLILAARNSKTANKPSKRALAAVLKTPATPDTLSFLLSGLLLRAHRPSSYAALDALASNPTPYKSPLDLAQHVTSYLQLVAVVPESLLGVAAESTTCRTLAARDSHNSFGLRSLDDPDGAEFFGFGVWSAASYWNHACAPTVGKRREGRAWLFWAAADVRRGDQLTISYLGGAEGRKMPPRDERRATLRKNWGFECACEACAREG